MVTAGRLMLGAIILACAAPTAQAGGVNLFEGVERTPGLEFTLPATVGSARTTGLTRELPGRDLSYDVTVGKSTFSALLDWHPFGSGFRTTGGFLVNGDNGGETMFPRGRFEHARAFPMMPAPGRGLDFNSSTPYLGVGWGQSVGREQVLSFSVDVGVLLQTGADPRYAASGETGGQQATIAEYLKNGELAAVFDKLYYSPVVSMGVGFRF